MSPQVPPGAPLPPEDPGAPPALHRHFSAPDYSRPLLEPTPAQHARLLALLELLYGRERAEQHYPELLRLMRVYHAHRPPELVLADRGFDPSDRFSERDVILITYGDLLSSPGERPLETLASFVSRFMRGAINTIHLLPFFPYSSDRGFAIIDFEEVDPRLGSWDDITRLETQFRLMFDGVFGHVSTQSRWFQRFLNCRPGYEEYFVSFPAREAISSDDLRLILRPRTSELLTRFDTMKGPRWVWTTFSADQVDLNFKNPHVLLRVIEVLLLYVRRGADILRLDAVTYIWRELGTRCAHLVQTHAVVELFRAVLDVAAPRVALITETNVPHVDNVSYFGDGWNEAQMVYNFALPPLVLHTFLTGDATRLASWAADLNPPSPATTFFNFLDSHDGIGLLGAQGLLEEVEIDRMVQTVQQRGGVVSYRSAGDGRPSPYELNITWYSALNAEDAGEDVELQVRRFVASRSIALALRGVPGIYLPSLFGSKNDIEAVKAGEGARAINRDTIDVPALVRMLRNHRTWVSKVARRFGRLIRRRIAVPAFHPGAAQQVLSLNPHVFTVLRTARNGERVLALTNVSSREEEIAVPREVAGDTTAWEDLISHRRVPLAPAGIEIRLGPYEVLWLSPVDDRDP